MRKKLQRAAAIGMAAILCIQNAQFGLTTFADELSDFARMEGILNAQEMRATPSDAEKNLPGGTPGEDRNTDKNGEIKENPDGNSAGQENEQGDTEKASDSDAKKEENSGIGDNTKKDETVVLLSKGEIDSKKVRVEFSLEDMDMSGFQKGATYEQIKAYVLEHTGLKVSSLYISQIKRKCGLDVGQNYNLSKKEDAKVPKCPPEKEAAIRDALKYFQMI